MADTMNDLFIYEVGKEGHDVDFRQKKADIARKVLLKMANNNSEKMEKYLSYFKQISNK